jgi:uncharacterized protein YyaL (SSP411 family)
VLPESPLAATYLESARRAAAFIRETLWRAGDRTLLRRYRDGDAAIEGYAEDYAYLAWGLLELFQADGDAGWLEWALALQERMDELFWDDAEGGWFSTTGQDDTVLLRLKEDYDGAEPAASSVATLNALAIAHLTGDQRARARAERTLGRYGARIGSAARAVPMMLCALSGWHAGYSQVALVGAPGPGQAALAGEIAKHYLPFALIVPVRPGAAQASLSRLLPFVAAMSAGDGAAAYVCRDFTCRQPAGSVEALRAELDASGRA